MTVETSLVYTFLLSDESTPKATLRHVKSNATNAEIKAFGDAAKKFLWEVQSYSVDKVTKTTEPVEL